LTPVAVMSGGFSERQLAMIVEASQDPEHPVPENGPMIDDIVANRHITRTRSDWIDDDDLYAHPQWQLYRKPMGSDHYLFSIYRVGENYISGIGLHRPPGAPDFTPRERRLAHIVMSEIDWLHTADIPKDEVGVEVSRLTPRLRVVFSLLVRGWNRKQIASHLGLTPNTVAGYIKSIYRSFEVSSQPELISRFVSGDGGDAKP
ncbi:MAG: helix-turn-helix transcriptional regulator, partial [Planctomycetota bacterium]